MQFNHFRVASAIVVGVVTNGCAVKTTQSDETEPVFFAHEAVMGNCTGGLSLSPTSPNVPGAQVTLTGSSTCQTGTPEFKYWVRAPGGAWTILCNWQSGTTCNWDTTALPAGVYEFNLWTRAQGSTDPYEGHSGVPTFELVGSAGCVASTISASPATPQFVGTNVTLSSTATCTSGLTPHYQFWARPPGGSWSIVCSYQASSTCNWTPNAAGDWELSTWTRAAGSGAPYEGYSPVAAYHAGGTGTCTTASLAVTPGGGGLVDLAGSGTCSNQATAEYKYWVRNPAGQWSAACNWKPGSCSWDTTGLPEGQYGLQVWSRARGSSAGYEGYSGLQNHAIGNPTCSAVTYDGALPASPSSAGTTVALSASSVCSGGAVAQYKTWLRPSAGAWSVLCDWTAATSCDWVNPTVGTYEIQVWQRMTSSAAPYDSFTAVQSHEIQ
jgi:hypothetical protein